MTYTAPLFLDDTGSMGYGTTTSYVASVLGNSYLPATNDLPGGHVIKAYATDGTETTGTFDMFALTVNELKALSL